MGASAAERRGSRRRVMVAASSMALPPCVLPYGSHPECQLSRVHAGAIRAACGTARFASWFCYSGDVIGGCGDSHSSGAVPAGRDPVATLVGARCWRRKDRTAEDPSPSVSRPPSGLVARRGLPVSGQRQCRLFTRGLRFPKARRPNARDLMNHAMQRPSRLGHIPGSPGGIAPALVGLPLFPELSDGPLPASLPCRPPGAIPIRAAFGTKPAHRSSGLNDETHADRRHARGRNPRGGAGR